MPRRHAAAALLASRSAVATVATFTIAVLVGPLASPSGAAGSALDVRDPVATQGEVVAAVYFTLAGGSQDDVLVGVSASIGEASIHSFEFRDGLGTMRTLDEVKVPAETFVPFAPGGLHVMLESLSRPFELGDRFDLRLEFAKAGERVLSVSVVTDDEIADLAIVAEALAPPPGSTHSAESGTSAGNGTVPVIIGVVAAIGLAAAGGLLLIRRQRRYAGPSVSSERASRSA